MEERRSMEAVRDPNADTKEEAADRIEPIAKKAPEKFETFGEQLQAIVRASQPGVSTTEWDRRLQDLFEPGKGYQAAATGASEGVPSDGGFLVQTDFSTAFLNMMHDVGAVASRVRRIPLSGGSNGIKLPMVDESSRADGSRWGAVRGYWANEADTVTATKLKFREAELALKKLFGLSYATEELLRDASALEAVMSRAFMEELTFKVEDAIINGTGSGQPLGILNSGALISAAADSGQTADTVTTTNILNMASRLPVKSRMNAVWLINLDVEPQLWQLTLGSGTAVTLLYHPPGVSGPNANNPFGSLLGRPVIPVEYCATVGTVGDILLVDLDQYLMIDKDGVQQASSMHVRFIYDEMTFRWTYRVDGQPAQRVAITPKNGTTTHSPYVALAAR